MLERRNELEEIFKNIGENEKKLINPLIDEVVFLEMQMDYLKKLPFLRVHPTDSSKQLTTKAAKQYKEFSQSYMNAIRILCGLLNKQDNSAENELLERLKGFDL